MYKIVKLLRLFLLTAALPSCMEDTGQGRSAGQLPLSESDKYFEDYDPPRFKWGYINQQNELMISNQFDACREFSEGLAAANMQGSWGYINTKGQYIIKPQYRAAFSFVDHCARVQNFDKSFSIIDTTGYVLFNSQATLSDRKNGMTKYKTIEGYNYFDSNWKPILEHTVAAARNFNEDHAVIVVDKKYGLIDTAGKIVLEPLYDRVGDVRDGITKVTKNNETGFYHLQGGAIYLKQYQRLTDLFEGVAFAKSGQKWSVVNDHLQVTHEMENEEIQSITYAGEARWIVQLDNGFRIVDHRGRFVGSSTYSIIYRYSESKAAFQENQLWGFIDLNGREIIPPLFGLIWDFKEGLARAAAPGGIGFIDEQGGFVVDPVHYEVRDFSHGLARVQIMQ